jgi:hypothetical protein
MDVATTHRETAMDKRIKMATLVGGALLLLAGILTHGWYTAERSRGSRSDSMGLGLWGTVSMERCRKGVCRSRTVDISDKAKGSTSTGLIMGKIGFIAGLLAAAGLILLAVFVGIGHPSEAVVTKGLTSLLSLTMVCAVMFLTLVEAKKSSVGFSAFLFFPGVLAGMIGAQLKAKVDGQAPSQSGGMPAQAAGPMAG